MVYEGVPINDAQRLLEHSRPSTTLDLYTHHQPELDSRVYGLVADDLLTEDIAKEPDDAGDAAADGR